MQKQLAEPGFREQREIIAANTPPEPPKTRTIKKDNDLITEQWDPRTGRYHEIARAPRKDPSTNVTVNHNPSELEKPVIKSLQETITNSDTQLDLLSDLDAQFTPEFLTLEGDIKSKALATGEYLGRKLSDSQKKYLTDRTTFLADTAENLNAYINSLSGAAVSEQEAERLKLAQPTTDDSPTEYYAKLQNRVKRVKIARARANLALELGITDVGQVESISALTESSFRASLNKAAEKWVQQWTTSGMSEEQATQMALEKVNRVIKISDGVSAL
jgi:hypothetical protein